MYLKLFLFSREMSFAISFVPDNTYNVVSEINAQPFEVAPPWRPNSDTIVASAYPNPVTAVEKGGSMLFPGTSGSYLSVPNDIDFRFRTGQFTIEWFQYMTSQTANPRVLHMVHFLQHLLVYPLKVVNSIFG